MEEAAGGQESCDDPGRPARPHLPDRPLVFHQTPGYYQGEPIAAGIGDLPALDGVLITHAHYDHCDMQAFAAYRDRDVPLCVAATVTGEAGKHGFGNVTPLEPWQHAEADGVSITAAPAKLGVPEVTYVLRSG